MTNPWVEHVRQFAKANNMTYMCAITEASKTYKKKPKDNKMKPKQKTSPKDDRVFVLEAELDKLKTDYKVVNTATGIMKTLTGKRTKKHFAEVPNKEHITTQYNKILRELETLTNKIYIPLEDQFKPLTKKQKQDLKELEEREYLKQKKTFEEMYNIMTPLEKIEYDKPYVIKKKSPFFKIN